MSAIRAHLTTWAARREAFGKAAVRSSNRARRGLRIRGTGSHEDFRIVLFVLRAMLVFATPALDGANLTGPH